jgi:hypothetical protein
METITQQQKRIAAPWWGWFATFAVFPPAGYAALLVVGRVSSAPRALVAGLITGAVLGAGQWLPLRRRGVSTRWIGATAVGMGVGLTAGAALVGYRTDRPSLAVMGLVSGAAVGLAQGFTVGRVPVWTAATSVLFALGWMVTASAGINVDLQFPVFGLFGALVVAMFQSLFVGRVLALESAAAR